MIFIPITNYYIQRVKPAWETSPILRDTLKPYNEKLLVSYNHLLPKTTSASSVSMLFQHVWLVNPYAAGGLFGQYKMMQKTWKIIETLAYGYLCTYLRVLIESFPIWQGLDVFQKSLHPCDMDENSLSIKRVKMWWSCILFVLTVSNALWESRVWDGLLQEVQHGLQQGSSLRKAL